MNHKIGISTVKLQSICGDKGAIEAAKRIGADAVDLFTNGWYVSNPATIYSKSDDEIAAYCRDLRAYADSIGIMIPQTHGRLRIFMNEIELDRLCLENARRDLLAASALGAPVCVMHGINTPVMGVRADPKRMHEMCFEKFNLILGWAKEYNVKIATETFGFSDACDCLEFFANAREFLDIFERIRAHGDNADYFTICVDTGHTHSAVRFGNPSVGDFIRMCGKNISCLHIHDNDGQHDQHLLPYAGSIDWDDVFDALDEVGYDGVYNLEVNFARFGKGLEEESAAFAVKILKNALENRCR